MTKDERENRNQGNENLDDIINQYSEDSELRRKINEMKKQKNNPTTSVVHEEDEYDFYSMNQVKEDTFGLDSAIAHTQKNERDETLIIMNQAKSEEEEDFGKTRVHMFNEPKKKTSVVEEPKKLSQEELEDEDEYEEEDEKISKVNKIIMGIIIGIISILLIVAVVFAVGKFMSKDDSDKDQPQVQEEQKEPNKENNDKKNPQQNVTKPQPNQNTSNNDPIKDNSATINRLEKQKQTYQEQLDGIQSDIDKLTAEMNGYKKQQQDSETLGKNVEEALKEADHAKQLKDYACKLEESSQDCKDKKDALDRANRAYQVAKEAFETNGGAVDYTKEINQLSAQIEQLENKKPDLEYKITGIETELYNLKK